MPSDCGESPILTADEPSTEYNQLSQTSQERESPQLLPRNSVGRKPSTSAASAAAATSLLDFLREDGGVSLFPLPCMECPDIVSALATSDDGTRIYVGMEDGMLQLFERELSTATSSTKFMEYQPPSLVTEVPLPGTISTLMLCPRHQCVLCVSGGSVHSLGSQTLKTFKVARTFQVQTAAISIDQSVLAVATPSGLSLLALPSLTVMREIQSLNCLSLSPALSGVLAVTNQFVLHISKGGGVFHLQRSFKASQAVAYCEASNEAIISQRDGTLAAVGWDRQMRVRLIDGVQGAVQDIAVKHQCGAVMLEYNLIIADLKQGCAVCTVNLPPMALLRCLDNGQWLTASGTTVLEIACSNSFSNTPGGRHSRKASFTIARTPDKVSETPLRSSAALAGDPQIEDNIDAISSVPATLYLSSGEKLNLTLDLGTTVHQAFLYVRKLTHGNSNDSQMVDNVAVVGTSEQHGAAKIEDGNSDMALKVVCRGYSGERVLMDSDCLLRDCEVVRYTIKSGQKFVVSIVSKANVKEKARLAERAKLQRQMALLAGREVVSGPEVEQFQRSHNREMVQLQQLLSSEDPAAKELRRGLQSPLRRKKPSPDDWSSQNVLSIRLPNGQTKGLKVSLSTCCGEVVSLVVKKLAMVVTPSPQADTGTPALLDARGLVLCVPGREEGLFLDVPLLCVQYVWDCHCSHKTIVFSLRERDSLLRLPPVHPVVQEDQQSSYRSSTIMNGSQFFEAERSETVKEDDDEQVCFRLWDVPGFFWIRIWSIERLDDILQLQPSGSVASSSNAIEFKLKDTPISVSVGLYFGGQLVSELLESRAILNGGCDALHLDELLDLGVPCSMIPWGCRLCITVWAHDKDRGKLPVGWVSPSLFDHKDCLRQGFLSFKLWMGDEANSIGTPFDNTTGKTYVIIETPQFTRPVSFPILDSTDPDGDFLSEEQDQVDSLALLTSQCCHISAPDTPSSPNHSPVRTAMAKRGSLVSASSGARRRSYFSTSMANVGAVNPLSKQAAKNVDELEFPSPASSAGRLSLSPSVGDQEFSGVSSASSISNMSKSPSFSDRKSLIAARTASSDSDSVNVDALMAKDALYEMTERDRNAVWGQRQMLKSMSSALSKVILSAPILSHDAQHELQRLLLEFAKPDMVDSLELLDAKFPWRSVREYAVSRLEAVSDCVLSDVLLQLVQVLKYEPFHDSALSHFLLRRAIQSPLNIGHSLFWLLRAETYQPGVGERYAAMLHCFTQSAPFMLPELEAQCTALDSLLDIAVAIKSIPKESRLTNLRKLLADVVLPSEWTVPLDAAYRVNGLIVDKCKYMDSAKLPLWLTLRPVDESAGPIRVILKAGDDLRQDLLCLQLLRIMDGLWKEEGIDFRLSVYGCVATGDQTGFVDVVPDSETVSLIMMEMGGAASAFRDDVLAEWLRLHNPSEEGFSAAVDNFIKSTAGYCVASWILGLGDRHNDNVMIRQDGRFLHIDFGHFLGNVKRFLGINRDKAPFFFTKEMAHVIAGPQAKLFKSPSVIHPSAPPEFRKFVNLAVQGFIILRRHHKLFLNLFAMMLSTGMPELRNAEDVCYVRDAFFLDQTEEAAALQFTALIHQSLNTVITRFNNYVHNLAHASRQ